MQIVSRLSISADGYVTTPDGWPAQLADPCFSPGESHGIREFLQGKTAALMGRVTFEPALQAGPQPRHRADVQARAGPAGRRGRDRLLDSPGPVVWAAAPFD